MDQRWLVSIHTYRTEFNVFTPPIRQKPDKIPRFNARIRLPFSTVIGIFTRAVRLRFRESWVVPFTTIFPGSDDSNQPWRGLAGADRVLRPFGLELPAPSFSPSLTPVFWPGKR